MTRDVAFNSTFYMMFTTRQFSTGAPFTLAGTPVVSFYENDSLIQSTAGVTLGVDHDGVTGLNLLTIVASLANGFELGKDYHLVITTGTVDGVSVVGEVVGEFTIGRSAAAVDLANGTDGLGTIKATADAIQAKTDNLPGAVPKGVALSNFPFLMVDATDFATPETGLTVTGEISKDGSGFAALTNAVVEVANGVYKVDLTATEMDADTIVLKFTAAGAAQRTIILKSDS